MSEQHDGLPVINPGIGTLGTLEPIPPRHPDHFVCLRGPCRHYWHLVTMAKAGNPQETWEALGLPAPRKHHHVCRIDNTSFEDDNAFECSLWDPMDPDDLVQLRTRRERYFADHPEHKPIDEDSTNVPDAE
jgi:hypothetical protein